MKDIYFNTWKFFEAKKLIKKDPLEAKNKFENYMKDYPKDYNAKSYYSYILIVLNMPKEAKIILDNLELESNIDSLFNQEHEKVLKLQKDLITNKMRLLAYYNNYEKLLYYYNNYYHFLDNKKLATINFICRKNLGLLKEKEFNKEKFGYLFGQIIKYDENDFFNHIKKHLSGYNEDDLNNSVFLEDFPINEIIPEVKKYIPSDNRLCYTMIGDSYFFKYNDCGRNDNKITDYFKVVCFHNTSDIITLCPIKDCENIPHIDLNYLNKSKGPVKTLSQIEKFNRRFRR